MDKANSKVRAGFVLGGGSDWLGGTNYFRNLLTAVYRLPNAAVEPVIFTGRGSKDAFRDFPPFEVVRAGLLTPRSPFGFLRRKSLSLGSRDWMLEQLLKKHQIDVLSHSQGSVAGPTVGWIPDFQHVHLPEFFSNEERLGRDRGFLSMCERCAKVIVSSECARADLESFAPQYAHKARVLQFVATPQITSELPSLPELQQKYAFDEPYFLLPNQFWAHKNHRVVISALKLVKQRGKRVQVLATGFANDRRNPEYFPSLMEYARECDVLDLFRVLGVIPFKDLAGLMQSAVAFINPSRFEGWSTTVEEAKSMGKRILLSDIPVHREQSPELGSYFHPDDPEALAQALLDACSSFDAGIDAEMQERARQGLPTRQERFAATYQNIVLEAAGVPIKESSGC